MTSYYGQIRNGIIQSIGSSPKYPVMCGAKPDEIVELEVSLHEDQTVPSKPQGKGEADYWGRQDTEETKFVMIWASFLQLDMCFPYGCAIATEKGRGRAYRLNVKIKEN